MLLRFVSLRFDVFQNGFSPFISWLRLKVEFSMNKWVLGWKQAIITCIWEAVFVCLCLWVISTCSWLALQHCPATAAAFVAEHNFSSSPKLLPFPAWSKFLASQKSESEGGLVKDHTFYSFFSAPFPYVMALITYSLLTSRAPLEKTTFDCIFTKR